MTIVLRGGRVIDRSGERVVDVVTMQHVEDRLANCGERHVLHDPPLLELADDG